MSKLNKKQKIEILRESWNNLSPQKCSFNDKFLKKVEKYDDVMKATTEKELHEIVDNLHKTIWIKDKLLLDIFKSEGISIAGQIIENKTTLDNHLKYGYFKDAVVEVSPHLSYIEQEKIKNKCDLISSHVVTLDSTDYFEALEFSIKMFQKMVINNSTGYGTQYDKLAGRNGTVLNYLERHMVGKLGEKAVIKYCNQLYKGTAVVSVSNSLEFPDAADINTLIFKGVSQFPNKKIQVKTTSSLSSVNLKESKSKLYNSDGTESQFICDYYFLTQLLLSEYNSPFQSVIQMLCELVNEKLLQKHSSLIDCINNISSESKEKINSLLNIQAIVVGYLSKDEFIEHHYSENQKIPVLGKASHDCYSATISELNLDVENIIDMLY